MSPQHGLGPALVWISARLGPACCSNMGSEVGYWESWLEFGDLECVLQRGVSYAVHLGCPLGEPGSSELWLGLVLVVQSL